MSEIAKEYCRVMKGQPTPETDKAQFGTGRVSVELSKSKPQPVEQPSGEGLSSSVLLGVWTKCRPTKSGFYWYREDGEDPIAVEWDLEMGWVMFPGSDIMCGDELIYGIDGEFWSVPILPPNDEPSHP